MELLSASNSFSFFPVAAGQILGTSTGTCSSNWSDENDLLQERLSKVKTVAGTQ